MDIVGSPPEPTQGNLRWRKLSHEWDAEQKARESYGGELTMEVEDTSFSLHLLESAGHLLIYSQSLCCRGDVYHLTRSGKIGKVPRCQVCFRRAARRRAEILPQNIRTHLAQEISLHFRLEFVNALIWATEINLWAEKNNLLGDLHHWRTSLIMKWDTPEKTGHWNL